ncbi:MAG: epoxyqueuosine reductase, partial [Methanobrevibacter sp.]|nr:epoxyqueuosine reductase [Methanobrevibacter sp.]
NKDYLPTNMNKTTFSKEIALDSVLGENFKCSEDKREFFEREIGKGFKFKVKFQKWLKANPEKTYQDAINAYYMIQDSKDKTEIDKQFQYNQYIRDFFEDNKGKTLNDAIKCWNYKKSQKGHNKYESSDLGILDQMKDENMGIKEKNSKEIEDFLKSKGAEVVGFASLEGIKNVPEEYPNSILIGIPIEKEALKTIYTDDQSNYVESMKATANKLNEIILEGENYIKNEMNYNALAISRERVMGELKDLASKIPHKTTGTRSGIGWIGRCALLISPKYGAALRLSTLLTDMPIKAGSPIDDSLCEDCTDCQDACPVDAINEVKWNSRREREEYFDANKCFEYIKKEMERTNGKSLCAKCGLACPYTKEYLGIKTDRDLIKEI